MLLRLLLVLLHTGPSAALEPSRPDAITVSAAISLTNVLEDIAAAYGKAGGGPVRFNFAGSNVLARQLLNGAPADLFISADDEQMDLVERGGAIAAGSRVNLLSNRLAVVAHADRVESIRAGFTDGSARIRRLAIGDPHAVPAGRYAQAYLRKRGLWDAYESRIVPSSNVRAALAAVMNGAADAAIVYVTDVQASRGAVLAFVVPPDQAPRIVYPAALIHSSAQRAEAERFLTYLRGTEAAAIFSRHGFLPAPESR